MIELFRQADERENTQKLLDYKNCWNTDLRSGEFQGYQNQDQTTASQLHPIYLNGCRVEKVV